MPLPTGANLDGYEVLGLLGVGGMGEVYRARDPNLKRDVAIKVLPTFVSQDPDRLRRFEQEAQATAALNHPNILAVYRFGIYEGAPYLVSELLEGSTLGQQLQNGPLPLRKTIDYAIQIARGLAAAHEKGIAHRDLKPDNLFVTSDGRVKILDFGLAKLTQPKTEGAEAATVTLQEQTNPGVVLGTAGYISPEQVRAAAADHRADIFSFGAILYEMLCGKRAFRKPTAAETMTAILHDDPPALSQIVPSTPPALLRIVQRCLEKNAEQRFQSASDLAFALDALSETTASSVSLVQHRSRPRWIWTVPAGALLVLAWILIAWWRIPPAAPVLESVTQLTDDGEPKDGRLVSDGSRIYFNEGAAGSWKIAQVSATGGRTALIDTRLNDPHIVSLTADGSALLVLDGGTGYGAFPAWSIPLPAGEPRRLENTTAQDATFFPDDRLFLVKGRDLFAADKDGSNEHKLASIPGIVILEDPSVSPDGKRATLTVYSRGWSTSALFEGSSDGNPVPARLNASPDAHPCCARWTSDGKYLVYMASTQQAGLDLWALPIPTGVFGRAREAVRLTTGPLSYSGAVPSRSGKQIFAIGTKRRSELVHYDLKLHQFLPFLGDIAALDPTFSRDAQWVAYASYPDHALWRSRSDGTERMQLTYPPLDAATPSISPDGKRVAFRTSNWDLFVIGIDGGPTQLIEKHSERPSWSPDGNLLLFTSYTDAPIVESTRSYLQVFDFRTGKISAVPSSQGKQEALWINQDEFVTTPYIATKFLTFDFKTQTWTDLLAGNFVDWAVSPDSKYLYFTTGGAEPKAQRLRFADHQVETITSLKDFRRVTDWAATEINVAPDGSPIFARDIGSQEIYALTIRWP